MVVSVEDESVIFALPDRSRRLAAVRLVEEIGIPGPADFVRGAGRWELALARPDVARMEYLLEIEDHNGHRTTITDPDNPVRASGAFGDKSVIEFPGYRRPAWLGIDPAPGLEQSLDIDSAELGARVTARLWAPDGLDPVQPAPLVVVHDGPEYDRLGEITRYLGAAIRSGALPPVRAALLDPGDRNEWYSANPAYAQALCTEVLPAVDDLVPVSVRVGVGVSLGGLAILHAHHRHPGAFDGLLLQSGSFFSPQLDPQESGFPGFGPVTGFVAHLAAGGADPAAVPTVLTCGTVEENRANNEAMVEYLRGRGYPAELVLVPDAHNYTAWRDALDPHLTRLITAVAGARAA